MQCAVRSHVGKTGGNYILGGGRTSTATPIIDYEAVEIGGYYIGTEVKCLGRCISTGK